MRRIGKNGGIASGQKRHAQALRRERSRRAALARWAKVRGQSEQVTTDPPVDPDHVPA